jgi:hypothetical protein
MSAFIKERKKERKEKKKQIRCLALGTFNN